MQYNAILFHIVSYIVSRFHTFHAHGAEADSIYAQLVSRSNPAIVTVTTVTVLPGFTLW